jgi:hypothetical protein
MKRSSGLRSLLHLAPLAGRGPRRSAAKGRGEGAIGKSGPA